MPRDSGLERKVRSDEFEDMTHSLSVQVGLLLKRASEGPCTPPLYLLITDADDKTVLEGLPGWREPECLLKEEECVLDAVLLAAPK